MGEVFLGTVAPATGVSTFYAASLMATHGDPAAHGLIGGQLMYMSGPLLAEARNRVADLFLASGLPWLLSIDSDMDWEPQDVTSLAAAADAGSAPILGALSTGYVPSVGRFVPEVAAEGPGGRSQHDLDVSGGDVVDVDYVGAGFTLIHRDVFLGLAKRHAGPWPWFCYDGFDGEDYGFCRRARRSGYPVKAHFGVRVGHVKPVPFTAGTGV